MPSLSDEVVIEKLLRPLGKGMSVELARSLAAMKADAQTQARYDELATRANEGTLGEAEKEELDSFVRANTLLALLKAEAKLLLRHEFNASDQVRLRRKIWQ